MDTGDVVLHRPTGEKWVVAFVEGGRLAWCGWPEGTAAVENCELIEAAAPDQRDRLLHDLASMAGYDVRKSYAVRRLDLLTKESKVQD